MHIYKKLINQLCKHGKLEKTKNLVDKVFFKIKSLTNYPSYAVLYRIYKRLHILVEVKKVKQRNRVTLIPFPLCLSRRIFVVLSTFLITTKTKLKKKHKFSALENILNEAVALTKNLKTVSTKHNEEILSQLSASRSNSHFRW